MKLLKTSTPTHEKVVRLIEVLDELNLSIEFLAGQIRITDNEQYSKIYHNLALVDEDLQDVPQLPPLFEGFRLEVFDRLD